MVIERYIDLVVSETPGENSWSADTWVRGLDLLLHRLALEAEEGQAEVLWPSLKLTTEETVDDQGTAVLRLSASVDAQERDI